MCLKWFLIHLLTICLVACMGAKRRENLTLDQDSLSPQFQTSFCFSLQFLLPHRWRSEKSVTDNGFLLYRVHCQTTMKKRTCTRATGKTRKSRKLMKMLKYQQKVLLKNIHQLQHRHYSYSLTFSNVVKQFQGRSQLFDQLHAWLTLISTYPENCTHDQYALTSPTL